MPLLYCLSIVYIKIEQNIMETIKTFIIEQVGSTSETLFFKKP